MLVTPCQYGKQASTMAADRLHSRSLQLECAGPSYGLRVDTNVRSMVSIDNKRAYSRVSLCCVDWCASAVNSLISPRFPAAPDYSSPA